MGTRRDRSKAPWTFFSDRGVATLNTTIAGKRCRPSLGLPYDPATASARDVRAIEAAAAAKYAELVAGRVLEVGPRARIMTSHTLHELFALWLVEAEKLWPKSYKTRISQLASVEAWAEDGPRFDDDKRAPIERLADDAGPSQFATDRLGEVLRGTVSGEMSNLYAFFDWAVREKHFASAPPRPKLPRGAQGKRTGPQRAQPVDITEEDAMAMFAVMPEFTAKGGAHTGRGAGSKGAIRVRDVFRLSWELALRPGIAQKISVPRHYVRGQDYVWITRDIDKIGLERRIPLTEVAREILDRCAPESGPIFGVHSLTYQIKRAAMLVLPAEKARQFARYDFRHGQAVHVYGLTGDLAGLQNMLGHTQATTTNRYVRTREAHAARVIAALDAEAAAKRVRNASGVPTDGTGRQESTMRSSSGNSGSNRKTPAGNIPAGANLTSPAKTEARDFPADIAEHEHRRTSTSIDDHVTDLARSSGSRQEAIPPAITNAQRGLVLEGALWDAFDTYQLHEMGIELDEGDS